MHILHVTDWYLPRLGGIELHVCDLARRQRLRGDDVVVMTSLQSGSPDEESADSAGVEVHRVDSSLLVPGIDLRWFDVVHVHVSAVSPLASTLAVAAAKAGVPTVVTVHSLWSGLGPLPSWSTRAFGLRSANATWTAVSGAAATLVGRCLPPGTPVRVLCNAADVPPRVSSISQSGDLVTIASTMRLVRRKRPLALVRMFAAAHKAAHTDMRLVIVGDGTQRAAVQRLIRRSRLADVVTITGRLDREAVCGELSAADLYVAPTPRESFGLAALEARSIGLPVIARAGSGVEEFVTSGVNGLLMPTDEAMIRAIVRLADDVDLRLRMAEHNRRTPAGMTWLDSLLRHDEAYQDAAVRAGRSAPVVLPAGSPR